MKISVISVNYNSYDFANLLTRTLRRNSSDDHELIIVENSTTPQNTIAPTFRNPNSSRHGDGLNFGLTKATKDYILFLDIDCHFLCEGWEDLFLKAIENYDCVTVKGSLSKPIRVACLFMKRLDAIKYDWRDTPGYQGHRITPNGFDVGILAYHQMMKESKKIRFMSSSGVGQNRYNTHNGEEYGLDGKNLIFHFWHGSHLKERAYDFPGTDLIADKEKFFLQHTQKKVF